MGRPKKNIHRLETPERILNAALDEFAREGFAAAKLAEIAKSSGISRPSLLYHFATKHELYESVVHRCFNSLGEALSEAMQIEGDFKTRLRSLVREFETFIETSPAVASVLVREMIAPSGPGRDIMVTQAKPMIEGVESWIISEGKNQVRLDAPVRSVMMHIVSNCILRHATGELQQTMWGNTGSSWPLVHSTILEKSC